MSDLPSSSPGLSAARAARDVEAVSAFFGAYQDRVCAVLEREEPAGRFRRDELPRPGGGQSRPRVLQGGSVIESAAVNFTHTVGAAMPAAASERRPELAGRAYEAVSVSLIVHPRNPHAPTSHANFRFFVAHAPEGVGEAVWWFGGGFDLTPYYPFDEDVLHWHRVARDACAAFGDDLYPEFKRACDEYFYLPHRDEPRGVGGVLFDDWSRAGFRESFALVQSLADAYLEAYLPILQRRKDTPHSQHERDFQRYRRGRYVEFNLLCDRGTRFGLQAGARAESVLASLPPDVVFRYDWQPEPGSPEARLYSDFLRARDWLVELAN
jgi:coproporphyrinogen III oxidase